MSGMFSSRRFPLLAAAIGVVLGGLLGSIFGGVATMIALGVAVFAALMSLRNWQTIEDERPLLAEELIGLHETAETLEASLAETRQAVNELAELVDAAVAKGVAPTSLTADASDEPAALIEPLGDVASRLATLETTIGEGVGGASDLTKLTERFDDISLRLDTLQEGQSLDRAAAADLEARMVEMASRLSDFQEKANKLARAVSLAVGETRRNSEQLSSMTGADAEAAFEEPVEAADPKTTKPEAHSVQEAIMMAKQVALADMAAAAAPDEAPRLERAAASFAGDATTAVFADASAPQTAGALALSADFAFEQDEEEDTATADAVLSEDNAIDDVSMQDLEISEDVVDLLDVDESSTPESDSVDGETLTRMALAPDPVESKSEDEQIAPVIEPEESLEDELEDDLAHGDLPEAVGPQDDAVSEQEEDPVELGAPAASESAEPEKPLVFDPDLRLDEAGIVFQGIFSLPDQTPRFFECFSRLREVDGDLSSRAHHIRAAKVDGGIHQVDNAAINQCIAASERLQHADKSIGLFCNVSLSSLRDEEFLRPLIAHLSTFDKLGQHLIFELNQLELGDLNDTDLGILQRLREKGFCFSLDHIVDWSVDVELFSKVGFKYFKVGAQEFLERVQSSRTGAQRLNAVFKELGVELVVEKVEREEELQAAIAVGVSYAQGEALAPPRELKS
ncbi:MAG: EAL domain-containing protein [Pseudomonadota bacterium]